MRPATKQDFTAITKDAQQKSQNTWDAPFLFRQKHHLVLIYGQQMQGFPEHEEIKYYGIYCGEAFTESQNFTMWNKRAGDASYPVAVRNLFHPDRGPVRGHLFAIKTPFMLDLDDMYANGVHYTRVKVPVVIPFKFQQSNGLLSNWKHKSDREAWMYVGMQPMRELTKEEGAFSLCKKHIPEDTHFLMFNFTHKDLSK